MKRWLIAFAVLLGLLAPAAGFWQSRDSNYNTAISGGGGGFSGPGDVVSGAYAWYSCSRGYNGADTSNACNVCLPSAGACFDLTLSSGLAVVPAGLSTCNITTVICTVKTMYDKTGNSRDVTQVTEANRPTFRPAMASNGCPTTALPCVLFVPANSQRLNSSATITQAQPITISLVYIRGSANGEPATNNVEFIANSGNIQLFAGTGGATATAANGSWHAAQGVFNSSSSAAYIDGTTTTGLNPGTGAPSGNTISLGQSVVSNFFDGSIAEAGFWPSGFNATQAGNMNTNQHSSTNGYNF